MDESSTGHGSLACLGVVAVAFMLVFMPLMLIFAGGAIGAQQASAATCDTGGSPAAPVTASQSAYVRTIVGVAKGRGFPQAGMVDAAYVGLAESGLKVYANDNSGPYPGIEISLTFAHDSVGRSDDSLGIFQQRPSAGWGSIPNLMNPVYEANAFFGGAPGQASHGLMSRTGWERMTTQAAALAVQVPGNPAGYGGATVAEQNAKQLVAANLVATNLDAPAIAAQGPQYQPGGAVGAPVQSNCPASIANVMGPGPIGQPQRTTWTALFPWTPPAGEPTGTWQTGECTWFVVSEGHAGGDHRVHWGGDAWTWLGNAAASGASTAPPLTTPQPGWIAVYARSSASPIGHVAVVVGVSGTTYTVAESNVLAPMGVIDTRTLVLPSASNNPQQSPPLEGWIP